MNKSFISKTEYQNYRKLLRYILEIFRAMVTPSTQSSSGSRLQVAIAKRLLYCYLIEDLHVYVNRLQLDGSTGTYVQDTIKKM